jgi:molybdenum cofactor biosynthesis protein MoaC
MMKSIRIRSCFDAIRRYRSVLTHIDPSTNMPRMVDVSNKGQSTRTAHAQALVILPNEVFTMLNRGENLPTGDSKVDVAVMKAQSEIYGPKGPVFATAVVAGVQGAKNTAGMIPFCHPIPLESCDIKIGFHPTMERTVKIDCIAKTTNKTGVEMEALVGASTAALCIYDMLKAASHNIVISDVRLVSKTGGKSDFAMKESS